jgi:hypothetical protein
MPEGYENPHKFFKGNYPENAAAQIIQTPAPTLPCLKLLCLLRVFQVFISE